MKKWIFWSIFSEKTFILSHRWFRIKTIHIHSFLGLFVLFNFFLLSFLFIFKVRKHKENVSNIWPQLTCFVKITENKNWRREIILVFFIKMEYKAKRPEAKIFWTFNLTKISFLSKKHIKFNLWKKWIF